MIWVFGWGGGKTLLHRSYDGGESEGGGAEGEKGRPPRPPARRCARRSGPIAVDAPVIGAYEAVVPWPARGIPPRDERLASRRRAGGP